MMLRAYRPADLPILYEIDQACFPAGVSYFKDELAAFIAHRNSRTWVAEADGEIVGFLVANGARARGVHIITIDVVAAWRRRQVGSALMDAADAWARARRSASVSLEVAEDNLAAQRFYAQRGYQRVGRAENYYANGQSALLLRRPL